MHRVNENMNAHMFQVYKMDVVMFEHSCRGN
jgi:hypothetical protein